MKTVSLIVISLILLTACSDENINPQPEFRLFDSKSLNFEYHSVFGDTEQPVSQLKLQLIEGVSHNNRSYYGFSNTEQSPKIFENRDFS